MAMVLIPAMGPVIVRIRVRAFRSVVAWRRTVLGMSLWESVRGLIVMILSVMRHGGRRIIGRKRNVYVLLSLSGKGRCQEENHPQSKSRLHLEYQFHGVHSLDEWRNHVFNNAACIAYKSLS
jgi:hypothetical protein